jgi:hypothetical protein
MRHPAAFDMAARLYYLEPADLPQCARRTADGVLDRVLDAFLRRARDLDDPSLRVGKTEVGFAPDSPLEGNGFEPSVPRCARTADSVVVM